MIDDVWLEFVKSEYVLSRFVPEKKDSDKKTGFYKSGREVLEVSATGFRNGGICSWKGFKEQDCFGICRR